MSDPILFRETIYALSSGGLPAGVAVIRMSGPHVRTGLESMLGKVPPARQASVSAILATDGTVLDRGLVLFFEGPRSFTGEDCAELQVHGGRAVVAAILATLGEQEGFQLAEAGDFTRRAFLNGKIDLTGAEALADLISAETERQRQLALENATGRQQALYDGWARRILHARAMVEAELDFSDEGDIPGSVSEQVWVDMNKLRHEIRAHIKGYRAAEIIREGYHVVLVGPPNAGKSSLLNALARREVAIVTDIAGTTRDLVEVALDLDGLKIRLTDTAGLRETNDTVEAIGVERALGAASRADLVVHLTDLAGSKELDVEFGGEADVLRVGTKADLVEVAQENELDLLVSIRTGTGLPALIDEIRRRAVASTARTGDAVPSRARHLDLLRGCCAALDAAVVSSSNDIELRTEELRLAARSIERITGTTDVEDLLGVIFSEFCVGK